MSVFGLMHKTTIYKTGSKHELKEALCSLCEFDCDFTGENGTEYLWEEAEGFESNLEYCLNMIEGIDDDYKAIDMFLHEWLDNDRYYDEWKHEVITAGGFRFISLAALTYC